MEGHKHKLDEQVSFCSKNRRKGMLRLALENLRQFFGRYNPKNCLIYFLCPYDVRKSWSWDKDIEARNNSPPWYHYRTTIALRHPAPFQMDREWN